MLDVSVDIAPAPVVSVLIVPEPVVTVVESVVEVESPPPQAAKAPSANTNKSFFMFLVFFVSEFWY